MGSSTENSAFKVTRSNGVFDITGGSGKLTFGGHISRADVTIGNNVTGANAYTGVAHGGSRVPDIMMAYGIMNVASYGHSIGDKVSFTGGTGIVTTRANTTNAYAIHQATPAILNATTGVAQTLAAADVSIHVVCLWF